MENIYYKYVNIHESKLKNKPYFKIAGWLLDKTNSVLLYSLENSHVVPVMLSEWVHYGSTGCGVFKRGVQN